MGEAIEGVEAWRDASAAQRVALWARRLAVLMLAAVPVVALFNVLGQRSTDASARTSAVDLTVHSPTALRGGLLFGATFTVTAHVQVKKAELVLGRGWLSGLTINTIEPSPSTEMTTGKGMSLELGPLKAGQTVTQYLEYQVNPTSTTKRVQTVAVTDGVDGPVLASLRRSVVIFP